MVSRKKSAKDRQRAEFFDGIGGMDDLFAREGIRSERRERDRDRGAVRKACTSKNRYMSQAEANAVAAECMEHGSPKLHAYRCPHCDGWHLTSKPPRKD